MNIPCVVYSIHTPSVLWITPHPRTKVELFVVVVVVIVLVVLVVVV